MRHLHGPHRRAAPAGTAPMQPEDLYDWEPSPAAGWPRRRRGGSRARRRATTPITQGYLVGEVIRRIDGRRRSGTLLRRRGGRARSVPTSTSASQPEHDDRGRQVIPPAAARRARRGCRPRAASRSARSSTRRISARAVLGRGLASGEIPAAGGHGNARVGRPGRSPSWPAAASSTASACCRPRAARPCFEEQSDGVDLVLGVPLRFGLGYGLMSPDMPAQPQRALLLLGRLGWLARRRRPRRAACASPM